VAIWVSNHVRTALNVHPNTWKCSKYSTNVRTLTPLPNQFTSSKYIGCSYRRTVEPQRPVRLCRFFYFILALTFSVWFLPIPLSTLTWANEHPFLIPVSLTQNILLACRLRMIFITGSASKFYKTSVFIEFPELFTVLFNVPSPMSYIQPSVIV